METIAQILNRPRRILKAYINVNRNIKIKHNLKEVTTTKSPKTLNNQFLTWSIKAADITM